MEEKDLQKQEEYTFTAGPKVYHFTARRFKMLVSVALAGVICMVGALGYMGYNFYQFRQERADFLEYQSKKRQSWKHSCKACWKTMKKCCVICQRSPLWKPSCAGP